MSEASETATRRASWLEIDLDRLTHNVKEVRRVVGPERKLIAVVKSNGYGHGLGALTTIANAGADALAVGDLADAIKLRELGVQTQILLFGSAPAEEIADEVVLHRVTPTVWDVASATPYSRAAVGPMEVWLKVDTGAHRFGVLPDEAAKVAKSIEALPNLQIELAYTVFAAPATDRDFTELQFSRFVGAVSAIRSVGVPLPYVSCATSAVVSTRPEMYLNAVRCGHLVFGLYLPADPPVELDLRPAARALKTRVLQTQVLPKGEHLGYGRKVRARRRSVYGVVPLGRVDGLTLEACAAAHVLVRGARCPFIEGSLAGEHSCVDLTALPDARAGDEVVVWGTQEGEEISLRTHAEWARRGEAELLMAYGSALQHAYIGAG